MSNDTTLLNLQDIQDDFVKYMRILDRVKAKNLDIAIPLKLLSLKLFKNSEKMPDKKVKAYFLRLSYTLDQMSRLIKPTILQSDINTFVDLITIAREESEDENFQYTIDTVLKAIEETSLDIICREDERYDNLTKGIE